DPHATADVHQRADHAADDIRLAAGRAVTGRHHDVPGVDHDVDLPVELVCRVDQLAGLEQHLGQLRRPPCGPSAQQVRADERGDERIGRLGQELLGTAELTQPSVDDHAD